MTNHEKAHLEKFRKSKNKSNAHKNGLRHPEKLHMGEDSEINEETNGTLKGAWTMMTMSGQKPSNCTTPRSLEGGTNSKVT